MITHYLGGDTDTSHFKEMRQTLQSPEVGCLLNGCFILFLNIVGAQTEVVFTYVQTDSGHCVHVAKDDLGVAGSCLSFWSHLQCPLL